MPIEIWIIAILFLLWIFLRIATSCRVSGHRWAKLEETDPSWPNDYWVCDKCLGWERRKNLSIVKNPVNPVNFSIRRQH